MAEQNDSDKTTFKVKFLGDYHDIVIHWNDEYDYEQLKKQLFTQFESITGVPSKQIIRIMFPRSTEQWEIGSNSDRFFYSIWNMPNFSEMDKKRFCDAFSFVGNRFLLDYAAYFGAPPTFPQHNAHISYRLIHERVVPEGVCRHGFCQHRNTKSIFKKIQDFINNVELNAKIWSHAQPLEGRRPRRKIYRQFNILQYLWLICDYDYSRFPNGNQRLLYCEPNLYLRTRG